MYFSWYYYKNGLYGYVYDISIDYDVFVVDGTLVIHEYLIKNYDIK